VTKFFGVALDNRFFEWSTLPMGWSHSPFICQGLAWAIIIFLSDDNADGLQQPGQNCEALSSYHNTTWPSETTTEGGFHHIDYDNIGVFAIPPKARRAGGKNQKEI